MAFNSSKVPETVPATVSTAAIQPATVSMVSLGNVISPASAVLAGAKTVNWQTNNYPVGVGVNINLIRKISDSPKEFKLIRTLAIDTLNDGEESWVPKSGEKSTDLYVEITCSTTSLLAIGCSLINEPLKIN